MPEDFVNYANIAYQKYLNSLTGTAKGWTRSWLLPEIMSENIHMSGAATNVPLISPFNTTIDPRSRELQASTFTTASTYQKVLYPEQRKVSKHIPYSDLTGNDLKVNTITNHFREIFTALSRGVDYAILHGAAATNYRTSEFMAQASEVTPEEEGIPVVDIGNDFNMDVVNSIVGICNREGEAMGTDLIIPVTAEMMTQFTSDQSVKSGICTDVDTLYRSATVYIFGSTRVLFISIPFQFTSDGEIGSGGTSTINYPADSVTIGNYRTIAYTPGSLALAYQRPTNNIRFGGTSVGVGDSTFMFSMNAGQSIENNDATLMSGRLSCAATRISTRGMCSISFTPPTPAALRSKSIKVKK